VFFDTGTMAPPEPLGSTCTTAADCTQTYSVQCISNQCVRTGHPIQTDDSQCVICHSTDGSSILPIAASHEILQRTHDVGLKIANFTLTPAPGRPFQVGDSPMVNFQVTKGGAPVTTVAALGALSPSIIIAGPSENRQRLYGTASGSLSLTGSSAAGTLATDGSGGFNYTFPPIAQLLPPINSTLLPAPPPAGTYTIWLWIAATSNVNGQSFRNTANATIDFAFNTTAPIEPRQVITTAACNACHVDIQAHGGGRQGDATVCSSCHTEGAVDRTVGAVANGSCTTDSQCPGYGSWGGCDPTLHKCIVNIDPTPNQSIDFSQMIHNIHFARLRDGYAERNFLPPGKLEYLGYNNNLIDLSDVLLPIDVRNCTTCHADTDAACSATAPCGFGIGGNPHPPGWQSRHPAREINENGMCLYCHL
jgi:hypothetical protein